MVFVLFFTGKFLLLSSKLLLLTVTPSLPSRRRLRLSKEPIEPSPLANAVLLYAGGTGRDTLLMATYSAIYGA